MTEIITGQRRVDMRPSVIALGLALVAVSVGAVVTTGSLAILGRGSNAAPVVGMAIVALLVGLQGARTDCGWNAAIRLAGKPGQSEVTILVHSVGLVLGALTTATVLMALALWIQVPAVVVGLLLLVLAPFRIARPMSVAPGGWKVRREWERWGTTRYMAVFGWFLGLGFVTTMASPLFVVCALWALSQGHWAVAVFTFLAFAVGRLTTTVATTFDESFACDTSAADKIVRAVSPLGIIEGIAGAATGVLMLI
ncbi:hypothetical protein [Arthrobacter sp. B2a2-09]|uniref:hypothetical protein n=1 Tax=Arthrobacter sp. B2a2-09 TaxID=2952822 RepID=UPI0022CD81EF|nr:hypothetical protein [Arthrobacter sp. B2a2-09]MCZ9880855.1 hypothetical protein [Arthrobacter sp. B2a2-09]